MKNKKKVIGLTLAIVVLFTGTVFAAANELFEGFPIVKVVVNGKVVKGDVPGVNLKGRTMVPLRFIGEALGANISWDQQTYTAYVNSNESNSNNKETPSNEIDVSRLKDYALIMDIYREAHEFEKELRLDGLGLVVAQMNIDGHITDTDAEERLAVETWSLENKSKSLKETIEAAEKVAIKIKEEQNQDAYDLVEIYKQYQVIIDYYLLAADVLHDYNKYPTKDNYMRFAQNISSAIEVHNSVEDRALEKYHFFLDEIVDYPN